MYTARFFVLAVLAALTSHGLAQPAARAPQRPPSLYRNLPKPVTSFGAAIAANTLHIYSGHTGKAHDHSAANLSANSHQLNLDGRSEWQSGAAEPPLQGLAVVTDGVHIYRIGGLIARNADLSAEPDLHSVAEVRQLDPSTGTWTALPPLPEPRSSHDAVLHEGKIYVVGGWTLAGDPDDGKWREDVLVLDLSAKPLTWKVVAQAPFRRRALAVAANAGRLYAIGGIDDHRTSAEVDVLDLAGGTWSKGPALPTENRMKGFGGAALGVDGAVWFSGADGRVLRLATGASQWHDTGHQLKTPRFFHRMLAHEGKLLFIGGAGGGKHLADIETAELTSLDAVPSATLPLNDVGDTNAGLQGSRTWPGFRGRGDGQTEAIGLPLTWDAQKNVAWTAALRGVGQSSPVVWHDRVFVTSVEGASQQTLVIACLRLSDGHQLWERTFPSSQPVESSGYVSKAAPTPAVDEQRLYAFFESGDLITLDHDGTTLWQRSLTAERGPMKGNHGLGGSPVLSDSSLVVLVDHDGPSYLLAIDKVAGTDRWVQQREPRVAWSTPVIAGGGRGGDQRIVISSNGRVEEIDAASGRQLWWHDGLEGNTVPSPAVSEELVIVGTTDVGSSVAIRRGGTGQVGAEAIAWRAQKATCSFNSPLLHDGRVYYVNRAGVLFSNDAASGRLIWTLRLPESCWASPIVAGNRIYFFGKTGATVVLRAGGEEPALLARNTLEGGGTLYGVAAVDGRLLMRFDSHLICVGGDATTPSVSR